MDHNTIGQMFQVSPGDSPLTIRVKKECFELAADLNDFLPDCREKSLVITKLQEAMFWGIMAGER